MKTPRRPVSPLGSARSAEQVREDATRWIRRVDRLLAACESASDDLPRTHRHLEALRHRRETLATKLEAQAHHASRGSPGGLRGIALAQADLKGAWSTVTRSLERESES